MFGWFKKAIGASDDLAGLRMIVDDAEYDPSRWEIFTTICGDPGFRLKEKPTLTRVWTVGGYDSVYALDVRYTGKEATALFRKAHAIISKHQFALSSPPSSSNGTSAAI